MDVRESLGGGLGAGEGRSRCWVFPASPCTQIVEQYSLRLLGPWRLRSNDDGERGACGEATPPPSVGSGDGGTAGEIEIWGSGVLCIASCSGRFLFDIVGVSDLLSAWGHLLY